MCSSDLRNMLIPGKESAGFGAEVIGIPKKERDQLRPVHNIDILRKIIANMALPVIMPILKNYFQPGDDSNDRDTSPAILR